MDEAKSSLVQNWQIKASMISAAQRSTDWLGRFRGTGRIVGDVVSPAVDEEEEQEQE